MKVTVAENCGFCHGVRNAITIAEKTLSQEKNVYSLGSIIHNEDEVSRLAKTGLKTVDSVDEISSGTVLIRSHGAAPGEIEKIKAKGLNIVDATCVLVKRLHKIAAELDKSGYKVVVIGNRNHPEVQAVVGCAPDVTVVADRCDLHKLPENARLGIICQTTESPEHFGEVVAAIAKAGFNELKVINTLCKEAIKRQQAAVRLCKSVQVMFVLGGLASANTRMLAELCKKYNSQTFHLQNRKEFDISMVFGKTSAGITAGASTPEWVIAEFAEKLSAVDTGYGK